MRTLPDIVKPRMNILFVGTNPGLRSALIGHYFAGRSNMFWKLLHESKLTNEHLNTELDSRVKRYGYGLTDVIKRPTRSATELKKTDGKGAKRRLNKIISKHKPNVVAFIGKTGFRFYLGSNNIVLKYGFQKEKIVKSHVFLLPSTSGASFADTNYKQKLFWYKSLKNSIEIVN